MFKKFYLKTVSKLKINLIREYFKLHIYTMKLSAGVPNLVIVFFGTKDSDTLIKNLIKVTKIKT
jgi:hypothetical protein